MNTLTKTFEVSSRDEIVVLCDQITELIRAELEINPDRKKPIIISINGDVNAGKSILWDRIREKLLKNGGVFIKKDSDSYQDSLRIFETWQGSIFDNNTNDIRLFACNVTQLVQSMSADNTARLKKLLNYKYQTFADVILLSNTFDSLLPIEDYDLMVNINYVGKKRDYFSRTQWQRHLSIKTTTSSPFSALTQ